MNWKRTLLHYSSGFPKESIQHQSMNLFKKAVILALILSSIFFKVISSSADTNIETVFHVYMNDEFVGTVSDKNVIEDVVNSEVNGMKERFKDYHLILENKLTYIPEQVFRPQVENEQTIDRVKKLLTIHAEAVSLVINNSPVLYVKNSSDAEKVLQKLKQGFVSEKELSQLKAVGTKSSELPPLKENQSRLLDVSFTEKVSFDNTKVDPGSIFTVDQAVKYLQKGTLKQQVYKVKEGDVLGSIAAEHQLEEEKLLQLNPDLSEDTILQIGQELNITEYEPLVHVMVQKEIHKIEKIPYKKEVIEDPSMYKGDKKVKQKGKNGKSELTYIIIEENGKQVKKDINEEKVLKKPVNHIVIVGTKVSPSRGSGDFAWPTNGGYISSQLGQRWGSMHKGIDIARPSNRTIKAADNGRVVFAGWDGGYGNKIIIDHNNGFRTVYAHLSSINVSAGEIVPKGSAIGVMGATGDATGIHLHFEVYKDGNLMNPLSYL
ncbi:peptidoglycan DD-metalloendopeptidase family protein [Bacillus sp. Gen3]|nr:peptidoglycan DD-metalloendopeptidase family protein [Bacillus sp. Gen3]